MYKDIVMSTTSKTFCPLPWVHLHIHTNGGVLPCCTSAVEVGNINDGPAAEAWNSSSMKKIRTDLLNGIEPKNCTSCFEQEKLGMLSYRQASVQKFKGTIEKELTATAADGTLERFNIQTADFRFSNLCNFKCRSCNSQFSSSIEAENRKMSAPDEKVQKKSTLQQEKAYAEIKKHYASLSSIYFAGGEPLLQTEHWQVLTDLVESGRSHEIDLTYSTNGSHLSYKDKNAFEYWKEFKTVCVCLSVDAIDEVAEYWRHGTNWNLIYKNIIRLRDFQKENAHFLYTINSTLAWPTVTSCIKLIKHCLENDLIVDQRQFSITVVTLPSSLSLQSIPAFKKEKIRVELIEFKNYLNSFFSDTTGDEKINPLINFMQSKNIDDGLAGFAKQLNIDQFRGESFFETFPEHEDMRSSLMQVKA